MRFFKLEDVGLTTHKQGVIPTYLLSNINVTDEVYRLCMHIIVAEAARSVNMAKQFGYRRSIVLENSRRHDMYMFTYLHSYTAMAATEIKYPAIATGDPEMFTTSYKINAIKHLKALFHISRFDIVLSLGLADAKGIVENWNDAKAILAYNGYLRADYYTSAHDSPLSFLHGMGPLTVRNATYSYGKEAVEKTGCNLYWNLKSHINFED